MATIGIENLCKSFGAVDVLKDINLNIADGEFVVLVGPSGCGKSTLLRIISGLEHASDGKVLIGAKDVTELPAKARDIAMVFQSYALYPHMTVAENMAFSLKLRGAPKTVIAERVNQAAAILGLTEYLLRKPAALSGGQRQRVAMGRAIVRDPKVFLFDEPLSNLDAKLRVAMRAEIKSLHQRLKTTVVYVTHDQVEALTLADRIVVLRGGVVEQVGTPMELYDMPSNTFVAQFIGSPAMNLLAGTLEPANSSTRITLLSGAELRLPYSSPLPNRKVQVGIRPEHFSLAGKGDAIVGKVEIVEPMGSQVQIICNVDGESITALFNERLQFSPADTVKLYAMPECTHVFDAATGSRLPPSAS